MTTRIVPFEARHADACRALIAGWLEKDFSIEPKDRQVMDDPEGCIIAKGGAIFIAERADHGPAIGCSALIAMGDGGFELAKMVVDAAARGEGAAQMLLEACIAEGRRRGAPRIYLESSTKAVAALRLYRRNGFVDLPPRPSPYARADVWMELRL